MVQGKLETFDLLAEILFSLWAKAKHLWQGSWLLLVMMAEPAHYLQTSWVWVAAH